MKLLTNKKDARTWIKRDGDTENLEFIVCQCL